MFRSILTFIKYRKLIDSNKDELIEQYNIKIDKLYRLGTQVSIPDTKFNVLKEYKNSELDIYKSLNDEVKKYISRLDSFFIKKNLVELVGIYQIERIDENIINIILSYRLIDIVKFGIFQRILLVISILCLGIGFINLIYLIPVFILIFIILIINKLIFKKLFI